MKKGVAGLFLGILLISLVSAGVNVLNPYHNASQIRLSDGRSLQDYISGTNNGVDMSQAYHDAGQFLLDSGRNVQDFVSWSPVRQGGTSNTLKTENTIRNACHDELLYEFRINVDGTLTVTADVQTAKNQYATVRIYRNGNKVGELERAGNKKRTRSTSISGWSKGDKMQIKVRSNRGDDYLYAMCISNFKISVGSQTQGNFNGVNTAISNHAGSQIQLSDGRTAQEYVNSNQKSSSASVSTLERGGIDISSSNPYCGIVRYNPNPCRVWTNPFGGGF